jgi:hypothetical protein
VALIAWPAESAGAWEVPNGQTTAINDGYNTFADPAAAGVGTSGIDLYATNVPYTAIPATAWTPVGTSSTTPQANVVSLPPWVSATEAPTVAKIGNDYVMWFACLTNGQGPAELCVAENTSGATGTYGYYQAYYDTNPSYGWFDPQLWQNPQTAAWSLSFSREEAGTTAGNEILSVPLSVDGLSFNGNLVTELTYGQVQTSMGYTMPSSATAGPYIENPAFITDPQGTYPYNMMVSYGTWNGQANSTFTHGTYKETIAECYSITTQCQMNSTEAQGFYQSVTTSGSLMNAAGGSYVVGSSQFKEAYLLYAAAPNGGDPTARTPYFDATNSEILRPGDEIVAGSYNSGVHFCVCDPNGWELAMQPGGALAITNENFALQWSSGTSGGDGNSYAIMQPGGNFVIYDRGVAQWSTGTGGHAGAFALLQNSDGNFVIYSSTGTPLWASGT